MFVLPPRPKSVVPTPQCSWYGADQCCNSGGITNCKNIESGVWTTCQDMGTICLVFKTVGYANFLEKMCVVPCT